MHIQRYGGNLVVSALTWFQSQKVKAQISNRLWLKPRSSLFLFLKHESSCRVKPAGLDSQHKNCCSLFEKGFSP